MRKTTTFCELGWALGCAEKDEIMIFNSGQVDYGVV